MFFGVEFDEHSVSSMIIGLLKFSSTSGAKLMVYIFSENYQFWLVFN